MAEESATPKPKKTRRRRRNTDTVLKGLLQEHKSFDKQISRLARKKLSVGRKLAKHYRKIASSFVE